MLPSSLQHTTVLSMDVPPLIEEASPTKTAERTLTARSLTSNDAPTNNVEPSLSLTTEAASLPVIAVDNATTEAHNGPNNTTTTIILDQSHLLHQGNWYKTHRVKKQQRKAIQEAAAVGSACPEWTAATRFAEQNPTSMPRYNVTMVQLVGKWDDKSNPEMDALTKEIYQHNKAIAEAHGYQTKAITSMPEGHNITLPKMVLKPYFWKFPAILDTCRSGKTDIVWFLDADIVIVDPLLKIHHLWHYHKHWVELENHNDGNTTLDWLFSSHEKPIANSGHILINCRSRTSMQLLEMFTPLTEKLFTNHGFRKKANYEQNTVHWLLYWQGDKIERASSRNGIVGIYDNDNVSTYRKMALEKRIHVTLQTCGLSSWYCPSGVVPPKLQSGPYCFQPNHFAFHAAGMRNRGDLVPTLRSILAGAKKE